MQVYNPSDSPVALDSGRVIGGREHADVTTSRTVREHLAAGRLIETERPAPKKEK